LYQLMRAGIEQVKLPFYVTIPGERPLQKDSFFDRPLPAYRGPKYSKWPLVSPMRLEAA
jgi:hypothetical protein